MIKDTSPINVLVVDDSAFMRNTLCTILMKCPNVQVVGTAQNGMEAIEQVQRSQPDIMTLDVDMPGMNGLAVLEYVMAHHPLPVIMISAFTNEGAQVTFQALELGAVDFIPKDFGNKLFNFTSIENQLHLKIQEAYQARSKIQKIRFAGKNHVSSTLVSQTTKKATPFIEWTNTSFRYAKQRLTEPSYGTFPVVVIGSSTGGPNLLKKLVQSLPENFRALLIIIQHMPKFFTKVFSENLNAVAAFPIREAHNEDNLEPGIGLVAPGDRHLYVECQQDGPAVIKISAEPAHLAYRPSVDYAMVTIAEQFGPSVIGVVLSGMGNDGVVGCQKIKECGGTVLVQDEETALMYAMPRAVVEAGLADAVVSDDLLAAWLTQAIEPLAKQSLSMPIGNQSLKNRNELD